LRVEKITPNVRLTVKKMSRGNPNPGNQNAPKTPFGTPVERGPIKNGMETPTEIPQKGVY